MGGLEEMTELGEGPLYPGFGGASSFVIGVTHLSEIDVVL